MQYIPKEESIRAKAGASTSLVETNVYTGMHFQSLHSMLVGVLLFPTTGCWKLPAQGMGHMQPARFSILMDKVTIPHYRETPEKH